jgi:hypothetical protein
MGGGSKSRMLTDEEFDTVLDLSVSYSKNLQMHCRGDRVSKMLEGTAVQAGRSRVRFPMRLLDFQLI